MLDATLSRIVRNMGTKIDDPGSSLCHVADEGDAESSPRA
jgi:hypothetical protein